MPESPWGINPWGVTPWGIGFGPGAVLVAPAFVNARPYPPDITPVDIVTGGVNSIVLDSPAPNVPDFFNDAYLVYYGPRIVARRIEEYTAGRVCELTHDLPISIPAGSAAFIYSSGDDWIPDLVHMGVRPSHDKKLDLATLEFLFGYGVASMDGIRPTTSLGNPKGAHEARITAVGSADYIVLNNTAPGPPAGMWTTDDAFKGLVILITRNRGAGQLRRIIKYDAATKYAWLDEQLSTVPDTDSHYKVYTAPSLVLGSQFSPMPSGDVDLYSNYAGMLFENAGSNVKGLLCAQAQPFDYYNFQYPVQLHTQFTIHQATLSSGRGGIGFGFALPGDNPLGFMCEVMHDGGGGPGDLILRVTGGGGGLHDFILEVGADPTTIIGLTLTCSISYEPAEDMLRLRVHQLFPLPGAVLLDSSEIANFKSSGDFDGSPISATLLPPYGFFGAGLVGANTLVQYLRYSFMNAGSYLIKQGVVQGFRDGEVLSSLPTQSEPGTHPLQWNKPWLPRTGGRRNSPPGIQVSIDEDTAALVLAKETRNDQQHVFVRNEPQLEDESTRGFLYTARMKVVDGEHTYDTLGPAIGAVIEKSSLGHKELRLAFLDDLGDRLIGLLTSSATDTQLVDYVTERLDWENFITYRLLYEPANGAVDKFLSLFINDDPKPLITLTGATLDSLIADATFAPIALPGFYFGLLGHDTAPEFLVKFVRYAFNAISYMAQLFYQSAGTLPDDAGLTYKWQKQSALLGAAEYIHDVDSKLVPTNGKVKITAQSVGDNLFYYRNLNVTTFTKEHVFDSTDGMVIECRAQLAEGPVNSNSEFTRGIWTGIGVVMDDGIERVLMGFADGGELGRFVFVTGPDPETGAALSWADVQKWLDDVIRRPKYWKDYIATVNWAEEHLYRFERAAAITSDRNARVAVYIDDAEEPSILVPFRRGKHMDGSDTMEGLAGSIPRVAWGHLSPDYRAISYWREFVYAVSVGFDLHLNQELAADARVQAMVNSESPVLGALSTNVEES